MTLVVAPAGAGKTSLVCQWLDGRDQPACWLQLDENDSDPSVLFAYIMHAVRQIDPSFGAETQNLLQSARMAPLSIVINTLCNELNQLGSNTPHLLVLDDYHLVQNPEIDQAMASLVLRPPRGFHLIVISRHTPFWPLGKLRIENRLLELGAADLRFTPEETAAYLQLHETALSDRMVLRLQKQTEGWVTGLQLAVLALQQNYDAQALLGRFGEYVGSDNSFLLEYMVDVVLKNLPESILQFMYTTSICPRFNVALCQTLTGRDRDGVKSALRFLEQANLFLIPLNDGSAHTAKDRPVWYRYHHLMEEILVSHLQEILDPPAIVDLHRRAATWLSEQGYLEEALDHLVEIQDWETAERLLMSELSKLLDREDRRTIDRWLSAIPKAEITQRPGLQLMHAWSCFLNFDVAGLAHAIDGLRELTSGAGFEHHAGDTQSAALEGQQEFDGQLALLQAAVAYLGGNVEAAIAAAQKALMLLPRSSAYLYNSAYYYLAGAMQFAGQGDDAEDMLLQAYRSEQPKPTQASARLLFALASVRLQSGKLDAAYESAGLLLREARAACLVLLEGWAHDILGRIDYEQNRLDAAADHFTVLTERCYAIHRGCAYEGFAGLMLLAAGQGRTAAVAQIGAEWRSFEESLWGLPGPLYYSMQARTALMTGDLDAAQRWADTFAAPLSPAPMVWLEISHVTKIRCLLASGVPQNLAEAATLADACLDHAERTHNLQAQVSVIGLRALLLERAGDRDAAIALLKRGLCLSASAGCVRTFVEMGPRMAGLLRAVDEPALEGYITSILAAFPNSVPAPRTLAQLLDSPAAALTQREMEVLVLLASPLSAEEIAQTLFISYSTVRQHTLHIYEKLGVNKRRHAVRMAGELGLLK